MLNHTLLETKLGFDQVRTLLGSYCLGSPGKEQISGIEFLKDFDKLSRELSLTDEFRIMMITRPGFPAEEYSDLRPELIKLRIQGSFLDIESMLLLKYSYFFYAESIHFIRKLDFHTFPGLIGLIENHFPDERVISEINRIIDDKGEIRDNASPELSKIRKDIASQLKQVDKRIAVMLNQAKQQKWVSSDVEIAVRNGRLVIPVPSGNKRKINGVIHDESASGQTVYIEPTEVFELNNGIRELELAERREIIKILTQFADFLRPKIDELVHIYELLGKLDFIRAKTLFALSIGASKPLISDKTSFNWLEARHPLLYLSHTRQNKSIVPLDISLDETDRILIISGPNAGGKSVCLKTVGLLQYMLQCGLLVPMRETSETGTFSEVFIDIGDQQSIEDDLSTYSSHLVNIKKLVEKAGSKTLFLIDEFGSGTEPQSGGAIAEAVLEVLNEKKAKGVVTTHYANLKLLAGKGNGFINGAMLFDTKLMKPRFQLKIGKPGSSFAFEIASNISFPEEVLKKAGEKLGHAQLDFDKQVQELESEKAEILLQEKQLRKADELLNNLMNRYKQLTEELESSKKEIIEKARAEARHLLDNSNKIIEKTVREIRQSQADKSKTKAVREELKDFSQQIDEPIAQKTESLVQEIITRKIDPNQFSIGDKVTVEGQREAGELIELTENDALVAFRTVKLRVKLDQLELVTQTGKQQAMAKPIAYQNMVNDLNARIANFRLKIDLRGYRAEEALNLTEKYIDECIMLRVSEVSILHGKGNGVLRQIIRDYLRSVPEIRNFSDESLEMGGSGITVVRFRK